MSEIPIIPQDVREHVTTQFLKAIRKAEDSGNIEEGRRLLDLYDAIFRPEIFTNKTEGLSVWTIYWSPSDFPGKHVARKHLVDGPTSQVIEGTLESLRERFASQGLVNTGRYPGEDPCIVESWV